MTLSDLSWFKDLSIQKKLRLLMLTVCFVTLLASTLAFVVLRVKYINEDQRQDMESLSSVVAENVAAALTFNDPVSAGGTISALMEKKDVFAVYVFDADGNIFSQRVSTSNKTESIPMPMVKKELAHHPVESLRSGVGYCLAEDGHHASVLRSILLDNKAIGSLLVYADRSQILREKNSTIVMALVIIALAFTAAYFLSSRLQRLISEPILGLVGTMKKVSETSDYNLRSISVGNDEIGLLHAEFNKMLGVLEERDAKIQDNQLKLEEKNAELERFTYTVSHDLKSPLVTIQGFAGFLEKRLTDSSDEKCLEDLTYIRDAADKMYALLNDLLELSRVGRVCNAATYVDLEELVDEVSELLEGLTLKQSVEIKVHGPLPPVFVDRLRMREVIQNLLENAIKYMGGQESPLVEVGSEMTEHGIAYYVRDNGQGIPPAYHEKIFGLFERLETHTEGTGVGLALVKRIIEMHNGSIWVESKGDGQGATFWFILPSEASGK